MTEKYRHTPVMIREVVEALGVRPGGRYVDATLGEGGHSQAILQVCQPGGRLLGIDADASAVQVARGRLRDYGEAFWAEAGNFASIEAVCHQTGFSSVDGLLLDLGLSSRQLEDASRGFSFQLEGPLDMRFDRDKEMTADQIVNTWSERDLADGLWRYGQEPKGRRIARAIVARRPIETTLELACLIEGVARGRRQRIHPATRSFQALRIIVNQELESLKAALAQAVRLLAPGGRLAVITYHSLEASIVKEFLRTEARGCICPPEAPVCVCGHVPTMKLVTRKASAPSEGEIRANPRSRSARLRVGERI